MKEIIGRKKYDTATAVRIGRWSPSGDWATDEKELYRTASGKYFLASWHNLRGEHITPLMDWDALRIAELHFDADVVEAEFGPVEEA